MAAADSPVVDCVYPARDHADEFVAVLRQDGISVVVVPSDHHAGEWDVLVPAHDAARATKKVRDLLHLD